jgi:hypothetical protein
MVEPLQPDLALIPEAGGLLEHLDSWMVRRIGEDPPRLIVTCATAEPSFEVANGR